MQYEYFMLSWGTYGTDSRSSMYCSVVDFLMADVEVAEVAAADVALGTIPAPGRGRWGSEARLGTVD